MRDGQSIHAYFDAKASEYDELSRSGVWGLVRLCEERALMSLLGPVKGAEVLDLGCGSGFYAERMRARGAKVFGVDSSARMIEELSRKGIEGRRADVCALQLGREFHSVLAAGLIEFMEDERAFFRTVALHCSPGGRLVLLAPRAGLIGFAYEQAHAWMGCAATARPVKSLEAAAAACGWKLEARRGAGPLAVALRFCRSGEAALA